ncbi:hypothetical protein SAE02_66230 [Skermanella aerolata]|uniref:Flagellar protein FlgN n=1 Tax=Skermanella aerolata TaxID=393310 RepID=A0A512E189_9PROT|nr:hypothetical protein [Skermanella aerolata]KJB90932.1 hypothetical protein N826_33905 [Skermanella aerolata KACC 11604]GEO42475.1 hypothetical protein SAE02_66230 [Skermanella aerolata]
MNGGPGGAPSLTDMAAIERELDMIALAIGDTRVALQAGGVIDLAGLDDRVASICAGLEAQPHETARVLMPKLTLLVQDLTMLSTACAQVQADTELALRKVSGSRASQAYGRPPLPPISGPVRD